MLQESMRAMIEEMLNDNTQSTIFVLGQYVKKDDNTEFVYTIKNGYKMIEKTYIPAMMTFQCEYQALYGSKTGFATIPIEFLVSTTGNNVTDTELPIKIVAINEFVSKCVGAHKTIVDGADSYHSQWNMDALTNDGDLFLVNGTYFIRISTTLYIDFSDQFHYANEWEWYLNGTRIYPLNAIPARNAEQENPQILGTNEAVTRNASNAWSCLLKLYANDFIGALFDELDSPTYDQERVFELGKVSPFGGVGTTETIELPYAAIGGTHYWSIISFGSTCSLFKLNMAFQVKVIIVSPVVTFSNFTQKTYAALLASDTEGVAFDVDTNAVYVKILKGTAVTVANLYTFISSLGIKPSVTGGCTGIFKPVIIKDHTPAMPLGERAEVAITFVLSADPYEG